jgi:hypothetical protein
MRRRRLPRPLAGRARSSLSPLLSSKRVFETHFYDLA